MVWPRLPHHYLSPWQQRASVRIRPVNLINIRAAYHRSLRDYLTQIAHLSNFMAMLCVSVQLIEQVRDRLSGPGAGPFLVSGISLGGWVTNLHRAHFNTADTYVPLLAGAALDDVFTGSVYRELAGDPVRADPGRVRDTLSFEQDFLAITEPNVFPVLARYDQIVRYQQQQLSYMGHPIAVIDYGHITAVLASRLLHREITRHL